MFAEIRHQMVGNVASRLEAVDAGKLEFWGVSIGEIVKVLIDKALELGREYRAEIEQAGKSAVDAAVALDLPFIPPFVEMPLDEATRSAGYAAIDSVLDAILGPA